MDKIGTQTSTTVTALVVKKKQWKHRSMGPYRRRRGKGLIRKLVLQQGSKK